MTRPVKSVLVLLVSVAVLAVLVRAVMNHFSSASDETTGRGERRPVPVQLAAVETGPIEQHRVFSGTLESPSEVAVASKVAGRVERLRVSLADPVRRGDVVAELDNAEYLQEVSQREADLAVAKATLAEAKSAFEITSRELQRFETLQERGVASESQFDVVKADALAKEAAEQVAEAQVTRAEAELEMAKIRLGYTTVIAAWFGGSEERYVGERLVDEGDTVTANTPLLTVVELNPMLAIAYATERDYAQLHPGQPVTITTDAYPSKSFPGVVSRIAPVFRETSRQARVEMTVANDDHRLKPGMFARIEAVLERVENAIIVPVEAITRRNGQEVLFVVDSTGRSVRQDWKRMAASGRRTQEAASLSGKAAARR